MERLLLSHLQCHLPYGAQKLNALNACYVSVSLQITKIDVALEVKKHEQAEILSRIKGMELSKANLLSDQNHIMHQILAMRSPTPSPMKSPMKVSPPKTVTKFVLSSPAKAPPSTSKHGEKGVHIDDLSDDDELDSLMS